MKTLVAYYSRTRNTRKVAETLTRLLQADVEEIAEFSDRSGLFGYLTAGRDAFLKRLTKLKPLSKDPSSYDLVVVGTPIWSWNVSAPVRTYLKENKDKLKKVAFYCTMGGGGFEKAFKAMEEACGTAPTAKLALTERDVSSEGLEAKVAPFVKLLRSDD
jgi:flavodoxin